MKLLKGKQFLVILSSFLVLGVSFKVMVLVEGLTEVRPVNAIPPVAGLICGPVGALACAAGNLLADMAGTFSWNSILGVIGNFVAAYLPWRLWYLLQWNEASKEQPNLHSGKNILRYILISFIAAMTVAWILSFGMYVLKGIWMEQIYTFVFWNNFGFSTGLGMPILIILTSENIRTECHRPPVANLIIKKTLHKKVVSAVYLCLMSVIMVGILTCHLNPSEAKWMLPISAAAVAALVCQLI